MSHLTIHRHQESSYLRAYKVLHLSRTLYKSTLFMQNKPNFLDAQINVTSFIAKDYENVHLLGPRKTKPIQSQFKANSNPIKANQTQFQTQFSTKPKTCPEHPVVSMAEQNRTEFIKDPKTALAKIRRLLVPEDWKKLEKHLSKTAEGRHRLEIYKEMRDGGKIPPGVDMNELEEQWHRDL